MIQQWVTQQQQSLAIGLQRLALLHVLNSAACLLRTTKHARRATFVVFGADLHGYTQCFSRTSVYQVCHREPVKQNM